MKKYLIVNADDFGLSPGISRGIFSSFKKGIVTSTSVIVKSQYLNHSKKLISQEPYFDWGLHVVMPRSKPSPELIITETEQQLQIFRQKFRFSPSHIDFHQGFKFNAKIYFAILMWTQKHKISFRYDRQHNLEIQFYGMKNNLPDETTIGVDSLALIIDNLPTGITELICHPGLTNNSLTDPYRSPRKKELETLINPKIKAKVEENDITLINFKDYERIIKQKNEKKT